MMGALKFLQPVHGNQTWSRCFVILHSTDNTLEDLCDIISFLGDILTVVFFKYLTSSIIVLLIKS